ncbi:hypothetical protein BWQ96_03614 [Gracilariopsis chorda]|uniref:Uncharacterized protein n=1 Tax=Gracilariopsis chorda TaxID=448386 RepID=A0A2V3IX30_9FLOR|nr:hypothetical protein BWQ96_03614 [Gracilariopsis chorda]|eukprot:PXF46625.1 hypothetical protein BWQ96_03614 [Gracilariopsis chorda]
MPLPFTYNRQRTTWTNFKKRYKLSPNSVQRLCLGFLSVLGIVAYLLKTNATQPSLLQSLQQLGEERSLPCPRKKPLYIFLHLHKTGGNSLKDALYSFAKKNNFTLYHTCHPAYPDSRFTAWYFNRHKNSQDTDCNLDDLAKLRPSKLNAIDMIMGHQYFGAHHFFPEREVRYFTFVRHPLRRKISHFQHFEANHSSKQAEELHEYLLHKNQNYMVKRLSTDTNPGELWANIRSRVIDSFTRPRSGALLEAKRHLVDHFFFVGLQDRYAQSACMLSELLNVACGSRGRLGRNVNLRYTNITRGRRNIRGQTSRVLNVIPQHIRTAALRVEEADLKLYIFAKALYEQRLKGIPKCKFVA